MSGFQMSGSIEFAMKVAASLSALLQLLSLEAVRLPRPIEDALKRDEAKLAMAVGTVYAATGDSKATLAAFALAATLVALSEEEGDGGR